MKPTHIKSNFIYQLRNKSYNSNCRKLNAYDLPIQSRDKITDSLS